MSVRNEILGWILNSISRTIQLPSSKCNKLITTLRNTAQKRAISVKDLHPRKTSIHLHRYTTRKIIARTYRSKNCKGRKAQKTNDKNRRRNSRVLPKLESFATPHAMKTVTCTRNHPQRRTSLPRTSRCIRLGRRRRMVQWHKIIRTVCLVFSLARKRTKGTLHSREPIGFNNNIRSRTTRYLYALANT